MSERRDGGDDGGRGQSRFAQRGLSTEERMSEDDSARRFPGRRPESASQLADQGRGGYPRDGYYGSGGSYGYGGSFEHGGQRGYQERGDQGGLRGGNEQFYEATGGFGRDNSGYGRHGLGYPGREEHRMGDSTGPNRGSTHEDANRGGSRRQEDARHGYSQESGYIQSGGNRVGPEQGSSSGASRQHADGRGHEGGAPRGPYYGRVPQGYTRSDDRIREDVCDKLSHGHFDPSELSVVVAQGVVTLEGYVDERHEKFHAEEIAESVLGVKDVDNRLRLKRGRERANEARPAVRVPNGENGPRNRA